MFGLEEIESETKKYVTDLNNLLDFSDLTIQRNQVIIGIFDALKKAILANFSVQKLTSQLHNRKDKGTFNSQLQRFQILFDFTTSIVRSVGRYSQEIQENFIPKLREMSASQQQQVNDIRQKMKTATTKESTGVASLKTVQAQVQQIHDAIVDAKTRTQSIDMKLVKDYRAAGVEYRKAAQAMNDLHRETVDDLKVLIDNVKGSLVTREAHLKSFMLSAHPIMLHIIDSCEQLEKAFNVKADSWADDFHEFIVKNGIVRTSLPITRFVPFQFSFEDSILGKQMTMADSGRDAVIPVSLAEVVHETHENPENPSELAVKVGEHVYTYEPIRENGDWIFVQTVDGSRRGFVPSGALKSMQNDRQTVFTKEAQLRVTETSSVCPAGALLFVNERNEEEGVLVCEGSSGEPIRLCEEHIINLS